MVCLMDFAGCASWVVSKSFVNVCLKKFPKYLAYEAITLGHKTRKQHTRKNEKVLINW